MAKSSDRFELFSRFAVAGLYETEPQNLDATQQTPSGYDALWHGYDSAAESTAWVNERLTACYND